MRASDQLNWPSSLSSPTTMSLLHRLWTLSSAALAPFFGVNESAEPTNASPSSHSALDAPTPARGVDELQLARCKPTSGNKADMLSLRITPSSPSSVVGHPTGSVIHRVVGGLTATANVGLGIRLDLPPVIFDKLFPAVRPQWHIQGSMTTHGNTFVSRTCRVVDHITSSHYRRLVAAYIHSSYNHPTLWSGLRSSAPESCRNHGDDYAYNCEHLTASPRSILTLVQIDLQGSLAGHCRVSPSPVTIALQDPSRIESPLHGTTIVERSPGCREVDATRHKPTFKLQLHLSVNDLLQTTSSHLSEISTGSQSSTPTLGNSSNSSNASGSPSTPADQLGAKPLIQVGDIPADSGRTDVCADVKISEDEVADVTFSSDEGNDADTSNQGSPTCPKADNSGLFLPFSRPLDASLSPSVSSSLFAVGHNPLQVILDVGECHTASDVVMEDDFEDDSEQTYSTQPTEATSPEEPEVTYPERSSYTPVFSLPEVEFPTKSISVHAGRLFDPGHHTDTSPLCDQQPRTYADTQLNSCFVNPPNTYKVLKSHGQEYHVKGSIGSGGFAHVDYATNQHGDEVAIKTLSKRWAYRNEIGRNSFLTEKKALERIRDANNPYLMRMMHSFADADNVYIVMVSSS